MILFQSFVDAKGTCGEDFSEQGLAGCNYQTAAQRPWPSGPDKLSPASRKRPFGELLGRSAGLPLPYNKSFFSQPCISFSSQHKYLLYIFSHCRGKQGSILAFPSLPVPHFHFRRFVFINKYTFGTRLKDKEI